MYIYLCGQNLKKNICQHVSGRAMAITASVPPSELPVIREYLALLCFSCFFLAFYVCMRLFCARATFVRITDERTKIVAAFRQHRRTVSVVSVHTGIVARAEQC